MQYVTVVCGYILKMNAPYSVRVYESTPDVVVQVNTIHWCSLTLFGIDSGIMKNFNMFVLAMS